MLIRLRFLMVGLTCAALNNVLIVGLDLLRIHYLAAAAIAFPPVLLVGYALHTAFTFRRPPSWQSLLRYAATMLTNYPVLIFFLFVLSGIAALPVPVAVPAATILMFVWNYLASCWAIGRWLPAAVSAGGAAAHQGRTR